MDNILIGKFIGAQALGAYKYAYMLASLPMQVLSIVFNRVFFASYAELQHDKLRIKLIHLKALRLVTFFTFPAMLGLNILADDLVLAFLGEKWIAMGYPLAFLSIILLMGTVAILNQPLYLALGHTKLQFKISIFCRVNLLTGIFFGMYYGGLKGLLWGMVLARIVNFYPSFYFVGRLVGIRVWEFLQNLAGIVITGLGMFVILAMLQKSIDLATGSVLSLIILIGAGVISYLTLSLLFQKETCRDVVALLNPNR